SHDTSHPPHPRCLRSGRRTPVMGCVSSQYPPEQVLWFAAQHGDAHTVRTVVARLTPQTRAYLEWREPSSGHTPLAVACANGRFECVVGLLDGAANVNTRDANGNPPLLLATRGGHCEIVLLLLSRPSIDVLAKNTVAQTALDVARSQYRASANAHKLVTIMEPLEKARQYSSWFHDWIVTAFVWCVSMRGFSQKMTVHFGWLYERVTNTSGFPSLSPWKQRYCLVLRTCDIGVLELNVFHLKPGAPRPACPQSSLVVGAGRTSVHRTVDTGWFQRRKHTFAVTGFMKPNPQGHSSSTAIEFAASGDDELEEWRALFTGISSVRSITKLISRGDLRVIDDAQTNAIATTADATLVREPELVAIAVPADQPATGLVSDNECVVCLDGHQATVCVPCGHNAVCLECATQIMQTERRCPVCRASVREIIKIYRP
ncbi:TPA: hypothetical protein N0F65_002948, partial [Lagenidium giganteum]